MRIGFKENNRAREDKITEYAELPNCRIEALRNWWNSIQSRILVLYLNP
ncbi:hypothetical protein D1AOALGA4SA_5709 [Olavius algarvensis Delta 1 endosymbiont]|nr:hypothetical protein D1AOALGA4SA_5709 [Olavius algarvensis Delta 1 endosymbiont]